MHSGRNRAQFTITPKTDGVFVFHAADGNGEDVDGADAVATIFAPTGQLLASGVVCDFIVSGDYGLPIAADWSRVEGDDLAEVTGLFFADVVVPVGPLTLTDRLYWMVTYDE